MKNRIKNLRLSRKMTQAELAVILGISQKAVSGIENGDHCPSVEQLRLISEYFDVSLDWLVNGTENSLNSRDIELLTAIRNDQNLYTSIMAMLEAKKRVNQRLEALAA